MSSPKRRHERKIINGSLTCMRWWKERTGLKLTEDRSFLCRSQKNDKVSLQQFYRFLEASLSEALKRVSASKYTAIRALECDKGLFTSYSGKRPFCHPQQTPSRFRGNYLSDNHKSTKLKLWNSKSFSVLSSSEMNRLLKHFLTMRLRTAHTPAVRATRWPLGHSHLSLAFPFSHMLSLLGWVSSSIFLLEAFHFLPFI